MKPYRMNGVAMMRGNGDLTIIFGDDERMIMRMMQLLQADTEEDVMIFEMVDSEDYEEYE